jgi:hypothetical protein
MVDGIASRSRPCSSATTCAMRTSTTISSPGFRLPMLAVCRPSPSTSSITGASPSSSAFSYFCSAWRRGSIVPCRRAPFSSVAKPSSTPRGSSGKV